MECLKRNELNGRLCRDESKVYLQCRMDRCVAAPRDAVHDAIAGSSWPRRTWPTWALTRSRLSVVCTMRLKQTHTSANQYGLAVRRAASVRFSRAMASWLRSLG